MKLLYEELDKDLVRVKEETKEITKLTFNGLSYILPRPIVVPISAEYQDVIIEIVRQWQEDWCKVNYYESVHSEDWSTPASDDPPFPLPF